MSGSIGRGRAHKNRMFKDILQSKWFTVVILLVIGFFLVSVIKLEFPLKVVRKELKNLNQKIDEVEKSSLELEKLSDYLKSNAYLERQARLKLNYKKPDEKVIFVYLNPNVKIQNGNVETEKILDSKLLANLKEWWNYLLGE